MATYFLDTSALLKHYVLETGSSWVKALFQPQNNRFFIARIAEVEIASALARRVREGSILQDDRVAALQLFAYHMLGEYQIVEIDSQMCKQAAALTDRQKLRAYTGSPGGRVTG